MIKRQAHKMKKTIERKKEQREQQHAKRKKNNSQKKERCKQEIESEREE